MAGLVFAERPPAGPAEGLLVLHHGRGADEQDLLRLGEVLDPERRLHLVTPRGPLSLPGTPGYHWYDAQRVGHPDPETFRAGRAALAALHDELWERTGTTPERTVLGGFSQGTVMSYATGLGAGRPAPAGILALSGFLPQVPGEELDTAARGGLPVFIAHGRRDPMISVDFGRQAAEALAAAGLDVEYHESDAAHRVQPTQLPLARSWLERVLLAPHWRSV